MADLRQARKQWWSLQLHTSGCSDIVSTMSHCKPHCPEPNTRVPKSRQLGTWQRASNPYKKVLEAEKPDIPSYSNNQQEATLPRICCSSLCATKQWSDNLGVLFCLPSPLNTPRFIHPYSACLFSFLGKKLHTRRYFKLEVPKLFESQSP